MKLNLCDKGEIINIFIIYYNILDLLKCLFSDKNSI